VLLERGRATTADEDHRAADALAGSLVRIALGGYACRCGPSHSFSGHLDRDEATARSLERTSR
jgi:hypothetical protein